MNKESLDVALKLRGDNVYRPHAVQKKFHLSKAKWRLLVMGRQAGKTYSACQEVFKMAMEIPNGRSWVLAPNDKLCDIAWNSILKIIDNLPSWVQKQIVVSHNKSKNIIKFNNGHEILKKSAHDPNALVGDTLDFLWIDEAALMSERAWNLLFPVLFVKDSRVILTTTPRGKNWVYDIYKDCLDENKVDYEYFHCSSYDNPYIKNSTIDDYKDKMTEQQFREEILAEFLDDNSAVFNNVRKLATGNMEASNPQKQFVMGVDLAKLHDFTVITVLNKNTGNVAYWERFTGKEWTEQINIIIRTAKRYNADILLDSTGAGEPVFEAVKKQWKKTNEFKFNNKNKQQLIENLILKIEKNEITLPDIKKHKKAHQIILELEYYEAKRTANNNITYNAPQRAGFFDDCVISLALAVWEMSKKRFKAKCS